MSSHARPFKQEQTVKKSAKLPGFSALLLDLDGLILDTEATFCNAWQLAADALGYQLTAQFCQSLSGHHYQTVEQKLLEFCGAEFPLQDFRRVSGVVWRDYVAEHGIAVKCGVNQLLGVLKKYSIAYCLATNSPELNARECLQIAGISHSFPTIIGRNHVKAGKPAPEIFLKAAKQLQIQLQDALIVEDSHTGILAAKRAGSFTVLVPSVLPVLPETAELADLVVKDLAELATLIQVKLTNVSGNIV